MGAETTNGDGFGLGCYRPDMPETIQPAAAASTRP
jgi:hypothetical protein